MALYIALTHRNTTEKSFVFIKSDKGKKSDERQRTRAGESGEDRAKRGAKKWNR